MIYRGEFDAALAIIDTVLQQDSLHLPALLYRYRLYRNKHERNTAYRIARDNYKQFKDQSTGVDQLQLYLHRAEAYFSVGKTEKGGKILEEALALKDQLAESPFALEKYCTFVQFRYLENTRSLGDPQVEKNYLSLYQTLESHPSSSPRLKSIILRKLIQLNQSRGDYSKAQDYSQNLLQLFQKHYAADHFDIGVAHYTIGGIYYELMEYQKALDHYLPAYEIWKLYYEPSRTYMRYLTEAIGDMYWELGQKEEALPFYNLSVVGKKTKTDPKLQAIERAEAMVDSNRLTEALDIYAEALKFRQDLYGNKHPVTGACQNQIARAYLRKGEFDQALDAYQEALTMLVKNFNDTLVTANPEGEMEVISEQYLLESMYGKTTVLYKIYQEQATPQNQELTLRTALQAIELLEQLRQSPLAESSKTFWTQKYYTLFDLALELVFEQYSGDSQLAELAFPIMEKSKAFLLQNALRFNEEAAFLNIPKEVLAKEKRLQKAIREYLLRIEKEERLCENAQLKKLELWNAELQKLKLEHHLFVEQIKADYPKYYNLKYHHQFLPPKEIFEKVLSNEQSLLIEYFEGEKYIYSLAFSKTDAFGFRLLKDTSFTTHLERLKVALYDINPANEQPEMAFTQFTEDARTLYQRLLEPILTYFPDTIQQLYIIPDKGLFYLPFDCLLSKTSSAPLDYRNLPYLLKEYDISYSQSAEVLARAAAGGTSTSFKYNYLGFAPNQFQNASTTLGILDWNQTEVETVGKNWRGKVFTSTEATKSAFIQYAPQGKIQHIATHALIDNENPLLSSIIFQGDQENVLYTYELYGLPIQSELLILNACNTARGKWEKGEGMISLESAFQYAGCLSLLTSTWSLDDQAASTLTIDFLESLKKGYPKNAALAQAKRKYLNEAEPAFAHPYYWAGLRLNGNTHPVSLTTKSHRWWLWAGLLGILVLVFFLLNRMRNISPYQPFTF